MNSKGWICFFLDLICLPIRNYSLHILILLEQAMNHYHPMRIIFEHWSIPRQQQILHHQDACGLQNEIDEHRCVFVERWPMFNKGFYWEIYVYLFGKFARKNLSINREEFLNDDDDHGWVSLLFLHHILCTSLPIFECWICIWSFEMCCFGFSYCFGILNYFTFQISNIPYFQWPIHGPTK